VFSVVLTCVSVCAAVFKVVDVVVVVVVSFAAADVLVVRRLLLLCCVRSATMRKTHNDDDTRRQTIPTKAETTKHKTQKQHARTTNTQNE